MSGEKIPEKPPAVSVGSTALFGVWQPIETAPRDGTRVLGLLKSGRVVTITSCMRNVWGPQKPEGGCDVLRVEFGGYNEIESNALMPRDPTHWMPLPPSPNVPDEPTRGASDKLNTK